MNKLINTSSLVIAYFSCYIKMRVEKSKLIPQHVPVYITVKKNEIKQRLKY